MSDLIEMAPCPSCGSRDNLAVYTDHVWCFGCSYYESQKNIPNHFKKGLKGETSSNIVLPPDFSRAIHGDGLAWLDSYGITWDDIYKHRIGWSNDGVLLSDTRVFAPCLIFPVYDPYGNLLMWQGRYFGKEPMQRKYYTRGGKALLHILGTGGKLILVEDMLSAIKISSVARSLCLFGSSINLDLLVRLHRIASEFTIWLDSDKAAYSRKTQQRAKVFFNRVDVIQTPLDPKSYTKAEIGTIIGCG